MFAIKNLKTGSSPDILIVSIMILLDNWPIDASLFMYITPY